MKYRINFVSEQGEVIHTAYIEARNKFEVCKKAAQDPDMIKALQIALKGRKAELDFYVEPVTSLN